MEWQNQLSNIRQEERAGDLMADKVHVIKKTVRLMPQEAALLAEKASEADMNEAEYMRFLISQKPRDYPEIRQLLKDLINEVNRIGVNINQITFSHNTELYSEADKQNLIAYMRKLNLKVAEVVSLIGN